jgi:hypothetical protein
MRGSVTKEGLERNVLYHLPAAESFAAVGFRHRLLDVFRATCLRPS